MKILQASSPSALRSRAAAGAAVLLLLLLPAFAVAPASAATTGYSDYDDYPETGGYEGSYSYVRTLEGSATLIQGDTGDRDALQVNQPVLVGDRILVAPRGRAEVVLSDRNLLRIDGASEVLFEALAGSPDRQDRTTVLRLPQGNVQLVVVRDLLGDGLPRVDTPNVTVYPRDVGTYRITADGSNWSEVVARQGSAEVVTREGALLVRQGEEAVVEGDLRPRSQVRRASREDSLELWGERLDREARYASVPYVDDSLRYEAASLDRHGSWLTIEGRYAWRPRVAVEWRPYHYGRWSFSPLGLTWVSNEPWGWVPYHYGAWDYLPGHGWVWFPGRRFAPAWVTWHFTDHYVGWVPSGYLWSAQYRWYHPHTGALFRFGHYGWAGGSWSHFQHWTFCSTEHFGHRDQHRFARRADRFAREHRLAEPRRGLVTTDTRGLTRTAVERGDGIVEALSARREAAARELPDVTPFVARRRDLPEEVQERILVDRPRTAEALARRAPERAARPSGSSDSAGDRTAPVLARRPGERTQAVRPDRASTPTRAQPRAEPPVDSRGESWRTPEGVRRTVTPRTPETSAPARERTAPSRIEPRPEPPAGRSIPDRVERAVPGRAPDAGSREGTSSWRDRPPVRVPERSERYSIPRRVIDGVRSNTPGSTPFRSVRPSDRGERVRPEARSAPSTERRIEPRRVEPRTRSAPPPRTQPRAQPRTQSREQPRATPQSTRSRSSSPPPRARSSRSSGSRPPAASSRSSRSSRSSSARSSSRSSSRRSSARASSGRSSSRRSAPSRRKPPSL